MTGPTTSSFDSVYRVDPHGAVSTYFGGLGRPQGLAFDADGNLYVAASLSGKRGIVKITPDGKASLEVAGPGLVGLAFAPGRSAVLATTAACTIFHGILAACHWNRAPRMEVPQSREPVTHPDEILRLRSGQALRQSRRPSLPSII